VIGFDEIWNMIKDISPEYFVKLYQQKMETERRENIKRYMQFFYGNFLIKTGDEKQGKNLLENILYNTLLDTAHEKLFLARITETLARQYYDDGEKDKYNNMIAVYLREYPELIPFSGLKIKIKLNTTGLDDDVSGKVKSELKECNINWTNEPDVSTIIANINFEKKKDKYEINYSVQDNSGNAIMPEQRMIFKNAKGAGKELALRLFRVGGPLEFESQ
jgi:hypothetical protein